MNVLSCRELHRNTAFGLAFAILLASACRKAADSERAAASVTDSAGVEIVTNMDAVWHADSAWRIDSVPLTSIGGDSSDPEQQFAYIVGARRLSDGRIVVVTDKDVRWFGADGTFLLSNGATGDGPGEFRYRNTVLRLAGDTVVVADALGSRVASFDSDGALVRDERLDRQRFAALGRWEECVSGLLPDGSRFTCKSDASIPRSATNRPSRIVARGWSSPGAGRLRQLKRIYLIPAALDTAYPLGLVAGIEQFGFQHGSGGEVFLQHPFYSRSLLSAGGSPIRIATVLNPDYRIELWTPTGQLQRVVRRVRARRVPTAEERRLAGEYAHDESRRGVDPVTLEAALAAMPIPDSLPAATSLLVSELGELVVGRDLFLSAVSSFDVFDSGGRWLGTLQLPARTVIIDVGRDYLLTVRHSDEGVSAVEVLRLYRDESRATSTGSAP